MDLPSLKALRKVMKAFIKADGRDIVLQRPTFETTETGGYIKGSYAPVTAQMFRLVPYRRRLTDLVAPLPDGEIPTIPYVLVGAWNADVKPMDELNYAGVFYRVQALEPNTLDQTTTDRVVAQVIALDESRVTWHG